MKPTPEAPAAPSADLIGKTVGGDFRILRRLGSGGMGQVYLAEQLSLKRKVAVKLLRDDLAANPVILKRFESESKIVAQMCHPNVVQVYLIGEHEGRRFMVLEYVEGKSLGEFLAKQGPLELGLVVSLMRQIGTALQRAHELGIVHRDLKPANVLLTRKAQAKVADFGLSCCAQTEEAVDLTRTGMTVGTPLYMSPEQIEGKPVDFRSDVYSLGVTCYQMLAGRVPFTGTQGYEVALKHVRDQPVPLAQVRPDAPAELCDLVHKMLAKKPGARHQTPRELLDDVARTRAVLTGDAPPTETISTAFTDTDLEEPDARPVAAPLWKQPALWWLGGALALVLFLAALAGGIAIGLKNAADRRAELPPVKQEPDKTRPGREEPPPPPKTREELLREAAEKHLAATPADVAGVDACIELGTWYLDQAKYADAETLFKQMESKSSVPEYRFVGQLGTAIIEAGHRKAKTSHAHFASLFDQRAKDGRVPILKKYLANHPEFAKWVSEADAYNKRNGAVGQSSLPSAMQKAAKGLFKKR